MKLLVTVAVACGLLAAPAFAGNAAVEAPIRKMMDGFNKGDIAAVKALHVAAPTIIDKVPPFRWSGAGAFDSWVRDLTKDEAATGKTGGKVWFGPAADERVTGDHAYLVTPCRYTFTQKGKTMREEGFTAFVLVKGAGGWKVESWSWASPAAK